jgi:hypothetical protein
LGWAARDPGTGRVYADFILANAASIWTRNRNESN